ncbi:PREDICTED: immunoglobulin superfamily member 1-like [Calidris pugnax]|uniref:immunoglobulin superfamily member 1-like n=1 Tax=Calidris pugnax TaxID=198806 RepID=UPI00071C7FF0|nr:PREDICTED: immunoglobulin superfamily member 1-like [Calidris pugnax]
MMVPVTQVLAFGAWLVAQSMATASGPTISIFLKPPGTIPPGGSTTICCSCKCDNGHFVLFRVGRRVDIQPRLRGGTAEFSISKATQGDAGGYNCHYVAGDTVLARSETVEVLVTEFRLPEPVLSVWPGHDVEAGEDVVFRCTITHPEAGCYLYLEGWLTELKFLSNGADYKLSGVHKGSEGRYSCQCRVAKGASFEWSAVSKPLDLTVRDYTWTNVVRLALGAGVLLLLGLIVAEAVCVAPPRLPEPEGPAPSLYVELPLTGTSMGALGLPAPGSTPGGGGPGPGEGESQAVGQKATCGNKNFIRTHRKPPSCSVPPANAFF